MYDFDLVCEELYEITDDLRDAREMNDIDDIYLLRAELKNLNRIKRALIEYYNNHPEKAVY